MNKVLWLLLLSTGIVQSQNVLVPDSTGVVQDNDKIEINETRALDTIKKFKRFKAEGVSAVVGEYVLLDTDIDKGYLEMRAQGISVEGVSRCQLLGKLMEDKLYAHQAKQDSIIVADAEIDAMTDQQLQYIIGELGSEEKVVEYYKKDNMADLRRELFQANKENRLGAMMQQQIIEKVEVTPEEVRNFFYAIPEDDRPIFPTEIEIAQIVIEPEVSQEAINDVIRRLREMKADVVENGASFSTKAVLYSKDPGSARRGGLYEGVKRDSPMAKAFKDQAFSLMEGEVSEPFETDFGWHILTVEKIRGQEVDVRHVLIFPDVSQEAIDKANEKIEKIRKEIIAGEITFDEAARKYSDDKETRNNGGQIMNPMTFDTRFDLTKMDPTFSAQVYNLNEGDVSRVIVDRDRTGKGLLKLYTVTKKYPEHQADYVKDFERIKELALREKQLRVITKWQDEKIAEAYIHVNEDYNDCDFEADWLKK
jgi:peptidyl-prolyl cis-trans isomerase SurA